MNQGAGGQGPVATRPHRLGRIISMRNHAKPILEGRVTAAGNCSGGRAAAAALALGGRIRRAAAAPLEYGANLYRSIGVKPLINARGTFTIITGSQTLPEVKRAMDDASRAYVQMDELMDGVGQASGRADRGRVGHRDGRLLRRAHALRRRPASRAPTPSACSAFPTSKG